MPLFDAIQLFLTPSFTHTCRDTNIGRIWYATVQYILGLKGLVKCYVAEKKVDDQLWMFIVWEDEESHTEFRDSSLGVGIMTPFLRSPPLVYTFDALPPLELHASGMQLQLYTFNVALSEEQVAIFTHDWKRAWEPHHVACTWNIDEEAYAFLGLASSDSNFSQHPSVAGLDFMYDSRAFGLEEQTWTETNVIKFDSNFPGNTSDLIRADPGLYGTVSFDESEWTSAAYPNDLEFRPMSDIASSSWFPYDENFDSVPNSDGPFMGIITLQLQEDFDGEHHAAILPIFREVATQSGIDRLYWWTEENDVRSIRLLTAWSNLSSYEAFEKSARGPGSALRNDTYLEGEAKFTSFPIKYLPDWDNGATVELLTFAFQKCLTRDESNAFAWYTNQFLCTMMPETSSGSDVVEPYGPFWSPTDSKEKYVVFLRWGSLPKRKAWFQNFLANAYDVSGHLVHVLALMAPVIRSSTTTVHKVHIEVL
ncbi:hypothetical protein BU23DRAFT_603710 [Bimuria novae-zelandiae CBS 107.79]|uniref:Uncharacterized protein n=1 Tax=Bimuria novae-zelandiae CBS 107.79 TaxID=1447943 RepID=A0A6A5ULL0_9PLEO|nr:hypothetical protein BU23DRAFT_603710 [Bimuria novae-zelandiae CBS 107.79]